MFPTELSDGVFSLMGGEVHSTVTFVATLAADGTLQSCEVQAGRVQCSRITYDAADACLAGRSAPDSPETLETLRVRHHTLHLPSSLTLPAPLTSRPRPVLRRTTTPVRTLSHHGSGAGPLCRAPLMPTAAAHMHAVCRLHVVSLGPVRSVACAA